MPDILHPDLLRGLHAVPLTEVAPGAYTFPLYSQAFCERVMRELAGLDYVPNDDEPLEAQIPEVVIQQRLPELGLEIAQALDLFLQDLCQMLYGFEPAAITSIQAARYTPENTPHGTWHLDQDSDITLVCALTATHEGGGTELRSPMPYPTVTVPSLPVGHALLFLGRSTSHQGLPVTKGTRNLLVTWTTT